MRCFVGFHCSLLPKLYALLDLQLQDLHRCCRPSLVSPASAASAAEPATTAITAAFAAPIAAAAAEPATTAITAAAFAAPLAAEAAITAAAAAAPIAAAAAERNVYLRRRGRRRDVRGARRAVRSHGRRGLVLPLRLAGRGCGHGHELLLRLQRRDLRRRPPQRRDETVRAKPYTQAPPRRAVQPLHPNGQVRSCCLSARLALLK
jgi:hypothetical protein